MKNLLPLIVLVTVWSMSAFAGETAERRADVPALAPTYRIIEDPSDLAVAPRKYSGVNIEVRRVRCFYADVKEYRCFGGMPPVTIFLRGLTSEGGQKDIQESCGTIKKAERSPDCSVLLRFRFEASDIGEDYTAFYVKRTTITIDTAEVKWPRLIRVRRR